MPELTYDALNVGDDLPTLTTDPISRHTLALYCGASSKACRQAWARRNRASASAHLQQMPTERVLDVF